MEKSRKRIPIAAPTTVLLIIIFLYVDFFGGYDVVPFHQWMQQLQSPKTKAFSSRTVDGENELGSPLSRLVRGKDQKRLETTGFACDIAENSIVCLVNQPVRIDTNSNITVYDCFSRTFQKETIVKPYPLRKDKYLLQFISPIKILHQKTNPPPCQYNHDVPAVVFSTGIVGNLFHEFNDIMIPLFITTKHFQSRVLFILDDYNAPFVRKYSKIFSRLSQYEVMNPAANKSVHCFPGLILGLKYHDNLALDPTDIPGGYTMPAFREFLGEIYGLKYRHVAQIKKPKLMLISREKTRRFLNEDEIIFMMQELGFEVVVARTKEAQNLNKFASIVNSCSVLVGAHGAGLTNELFLPAGAVTIQVETLGMEWAAANYYGNPARAMGIHYLRYKIEPEESTLVDHYGRHHSVITDPETLYVKGYRAVKAVYLDNQEVRVKIVRFRETLIQALQLVRR